MRKKRKKNIFGKIETLISQDTLVEGTIEAVGTLRIDGTVKGGIRKADGVIIGETGFIEGNINAEGVSLAGRIKGNVFSETSLELLKGSVLMGDIETARLSIADGAHFDGVCTMIEDTSSEISEISSGSTESKEYSASSYKIVQKSI
ncbi:MAG: polymer-forming cytoskeletal protein [Elusimicrobia bacterium]|nr:polymer-forming cytoskeletal protein [Elusimicrobiota bacterium]